MKKQMPKRIAIHGCYNTGNYGDTLILEMIRSRLSSIDNLDCVCPWESMLISGSYRKSGKGWRDILTADMAVFGGGGYFETGAPPFRYIIPARIWQNRRIPYMVMGVSVGPRLLPSTMRWIYKICDGAEKICIRDHESQAFLQGMGIPAEKLEVTADIVLSLRPEHIPAAAVKQGEEFIGALPRDKRLLGLHFPRACGDIYISSRYPFYARRPTPQFQYLINAIAREIKRNKDIHVVWLFDHLLGGSSIRTIRSVLTSCLPEVTILPYRDHWFTTYVLGRLDAVITTHLHVGIAAWVQGVPCCSYASHEKIARFFRQIGRSEFCIPDSSPISIVLDWIREFADDYANFSKEDKVARGRLQGLADRNSDILASFMRSVVNNKQ